MTDDPTSNNDPHPRPRRVGIPRAFSYYSYPGLWESYFKGLGMTPVVSRRSTAATVTAATIISESEHCLPNKLFDGHLASLLGTVDAVFIPRVISMTMGHIACPKFGALPDAARASIARDLEVISFDINETAQPLAKTMIAYAKTVGLSTKAAKQVVSTAFAVMAEKRAQHKAAAQVDAGSRPRYLLMGHPYTLGDGYLADPVVRKLQSMDLAVEKMVFGDDPIAPGHIRWCTFNKMWSKLESMDPSRYAGVIQITTFNCGADTMMLEKFRLLASRRGIPYMVLMIDEHAAQGGLDTRLEAFVDSLAWRRDRPVGSKVD